MVLGYEDHGFSAKSPKPVPQVWWCDPVREPVDEQEARAKAKFPPTMGKSRRELDQPGNVPASVAECAPEDFK
ncbi:hypothetical protein [Roseateles sp. P5_E1]